MKLHMRKGFTLMEMVIVMTMFAIILVTVISILINVYNSKGGLDARQTLTRESYFFFEKLQTMVRDYTIDYEEYWNRQYAGCVDTGVAQWGETCTLFTHYGNSNNFYPQSPSESFTGHRLGYCSSSPHAGTDLNSAYNLSNYMGSFVSYSTGYKVYAAGSLYSVSVCLENIQNGGLSSVGNLIQPYGQYQTFFKDVKDNVDFVPGAVNDDDDEDKGQLDSHMYAVYTTGDQTPSELYLISQDKTKRLLFRRKLLLTGDFNDDGVITDTEQLYMIQILQLRGFDAGENHDFDPHQPGLFDGQIDTRACDYGAGFLCSGANIGGAYSGYRLPGNVDDGWQNLFGGDITVSDWKLIINPLNDPVFAWNDGDAQINPYIRIAMTTKLFGKNWSRRIPWNQMEKYSVDLQTTFSFQLSQ